MEITVTTDQLLTLAQCSGSLLGGVFVAYSIRFSKGSAPLIIGIVLTLVGLGLSVTKCRIKAQRQRAVNFATLPEEWSEFYGYLGEINDSLKGQAVENFVKLGPPQITPKQFLILTRKRMHSRRDSALNCDHVRRCVVFDFLAEGKK